jgi:hypothetical protein
MLPDRRFFQKVQSYKSEVQVRWNTRGNEFVNALVGDKLQKVAFGIGMVVGLLAGFANLLFQWIHLNTGIGKLDACVNLGLGIVVVGIPLMALIMAPFWLISKMIEKCLGWHEGELEEARVRLLVEIVGKSFGRTFEPTAELDKAQDEGRRQYVERLFKKFEKEKEIS